MDVEDRNEARLKFLTDNGWGDAAVIALPGDASFRRYFRLNNTGRLALLMDAPPATENTCAYVSITRHLISLGLSSPGIEALDEGQGFAVIEDFGNNTFTNLLNNGEDPHQLYELAVDALVHLHAHDRAMDIVLPAYDEEKLLEEASLLSDWFLPALTGVATSPEAREGYVKAWRNVLNSMPTFTPTITLRDYHIDNLMVLPDRENAAQCGLLDFQDALHGHAAYDLVSLLEDARRDVSDVLAAEMFHRYSTAMGLGDAAEFKVWYTVLGVQRHTKVAGIFVRLYIRDGKPVYLKHIPRVMGLLTRALSDPAMAPVKAWFDLYLPDPLKPLPEFDPATIRKLISY